MGPESAYTERDWGEHPLITITTQALLVLIIGLLVSRRPGLLLNEDGEPRRWLAVGVWGGALLVLAVHVATVPLDGDEVYFLTSSWAAQLGELPGVLPMRDLVARPFLALGLSPAQTLLAGRVAMSLAAIICGLAISGLVRRLGHRGFAPPFAGAVTTMSLATHAGMYYLRPEYFAYVAFVIGFALLAAPPPRWPRACTTVVSTALIAIGATTSLRHALYPVVAVSTAFLAAGAGMRLRTALWAICGTLLGLAPTVCHIVTRGSWGSTQTGNVSDLMQAGWLSFASPAPIPGFLFLAAAVGIALRWRQGNDLTGEGMVAVMWVTATVALWLSPQKMYYATGPWLALSVVLATSAIETLRARDPGPRRNLHLALALVIVALGGLGDYDVTRSRSVIRKPGQLASQLQLVDWLATYGDDGPVMCVVPYHPIRASNAWRVWNAWLYCSVTDPALNRRLNSGLETSLTSGRATVIAWDAETRWSAMPNVLCYAVERGGIPPERMPEVTRLLASRYRLVQWAGPITSSYGGGRFLVRRDLPVDGRVRLLSEDEVLRWDTR